MNFDINNYFTVWDFKNPKIVFGPSGLEKRLPGVIKDFDDILVVGNKSDISKSQAQEDVMAILEKENKNFSLFNSIQSMLSLNAIEKGEKTAKSFNTKCIIGVGDEKVIEAAKLIAVKINNPGTLMSFKGRDKFRFPGVKLLIIPDNSGFGSCADDFATVFINKKNTEIYKPVRFFSEYLIPNTILIDPNYYMNLSPLMTLSNSINSLVKTIESLLSSRKGTLPYILSAEALSCMIKNLIPAVVNGSDKTPRINMAYGSLLAGLSLLNSKKSIISEIAFPLSYQFHIPIGLIEGILLPEIITYIASSVPQTMIALSEFLQINFSQHTSYFKKLKAPADFFREMFSETNLPKSLKDIGVPKDKLNQIAREASDQLANYNNFYLPKQITKDGIYSIYNKTYS